MNLLHWLALLFIALKLIDQIDWNWLLILSPLLLQGVVYTLWHWTARKNYKL